jgi:DNA-binding transcriptional LysR family regulator
MSCDNRSHASLEIERLVSTAKVPEMAIPYPASPLLICRSDAIGVSIRALEHRLGIRLLARTTRNVSPTEAGERLMRSIAPLFDQIAVEIEALSELRDKPSGTIRISCTDDQIE